MVPAWAGVVLSRSVGSPAFAVGASILDWNYDWGAGDWIPAFAGMTRFFKSLDPRSKHSGMTIGGTRRLGAGLANRHLTILATTPAPTVRPPSRIAKRRPSSIATGLISCTAIFTLSPGITISVPSGSVTAPVMSVVRK